jgi:hypothetical protein
MTPLDDFDLGTEPAPPANWAPRKRRDSWAPLGIAAAVLIVIAIVVAYIWFRNAPPEPVRVAETPKPAVQAQPRKGLGPDVTPMDLPPLVLTDPIVRDLLAKLSTRPELAAWLATDGLIRNVVVCVENVAGGETPVRHLRALAPKAPFRAEQRARTFAVDARSFSRYDGLADTAASMNGSGLARIYSILKPRLVDAYRELGHVDGDIDAAVEKAIVVLLQAPTIDGTETLISKVLSYKYERPELEGLAPAQKQLLRMGPRNVRVVQDHLRLIARELGIPAERLPARAGD